MTEPHLEDENVVRISIALDDPVGSFEHERVWAEPLGNDLYCIRNTPWFVYGVNFMDIVRARSTEGDGNLEFREVVVPSKHETLRLYFTPVNEGGPSQETIETILAAVVQLGAWYEGYKPRFYAIDIPAITDPVRLFAYLGGLVEEGTLQWESGNAPPP